MVLKKTKLAIFTTVPTHPQDMGCRRRIYNLLEGFESQNCEIHVIYFPLRDKIDDRISISGMKKRWDFVHVVKTNKRFPKPSEIGRFTLDYVDSSLGHLGSALKSRTPRIYRSLKPISRKVQKLTRLGRPTFKKILEKNKSDDFVDLYYDKDAYDFVKEVTDDLKPEIFICEYALYSFILDAVKTKTLKLIDTHDSMMKFTKLHGGRMLNLPDDFLMTEKMEVKLLARSDKAIAIQDEENEYFKSILGKDRSITIGHKIALLHNPLKKKRNRLLFIGSDWAPNKEGINWFLRDVWPIILKERPDVELDIVGSISRYIKPSTSINIKGYVKNIDTEYRHADVVICPIREGSGLKIKAIEALGQNRPVVASRHVAEGFGEVAIKRGLFDITDDPKDYANKIILLLDDEKLYAKRQKTGMHFAKTYNRNQEKKINHLIEAAKRIK